MKRFLLFPAAALALAMASHAQVGAAASKFEVATIRLNPDCDGGAREEHSPGRYGLRCVALREVIRIAYGNVRGVAPAKLPDVLGGPGWIDSDRFDIEATAPGRPGLDQMYGSMTRALLEDRFHLKLHDEVRKLPVYDLTVLKAARLKPIKAGSCVIVDLSEVLAAPPPPNFCGRNTETRGTTTIFDGYGVTMAEFITRGLRTLDRPVIDQTQLTGRFDVHLEFGSANAPDNRDDAAPSIFTAVQEQLGLKLSASTGPVPVHVIDHVERPSGN